MSFLPDWYSQGVQGQDNNGGFGTAAMFNKPSAQQQGDMGYIGRLIGALRGKNNNPMPQDGMTQQQGMPQSNAMPQMTPYQDQPIGPNMGQVNNPNTMSPNGQIMPNWNRTYGGY